MRLILLADYRFLPGFSWGITMMFVHLVLCMLLITQFHHLKNCTRILKRDTTGIRSNTMSGTNGLEADGVELEKYTEI